ncbi:MBL fold metallo-hydrolase [Halobacteriovorax marinus]|uniref:MBL fold metallo-hydrolase n=1 Tax=Halobacteriovorax marinus TaxID=97084 RepID=UPI003A8E6D5A
MRDSVSVIFTFEDKVFSIQRQNYLKAFPGYTAFPGGKVDKEDRENSSIIPELFNALSKELYFALRREIVEELNFDLEKSLEKILSVKEVGVAITPEFNPYRFKTHFIRIELSEEVEFEVDAGEAKCSSWTKALDILNSYKRAEILAVPPTVKLFQNLARDINFSEVLDLSLDHNPAKEVPMIESIYGVKQFLPLSHTFPPANRTNCFLIGDEHSVLIDPSPRDRDELAKLINHLSKFSVDELFITHHHPDHHEFATEIATHFNVTIGLSRDTLERIRSKHGEDYFKDVEIKIYKEGDLLTQSCGSEVYIYEVPGHDEGQLALAPKTLNWFLVGDLIQTVGTVVIGAPEGDMAKYYDSLNRVIDLDPKFIIPSHGIAIGGVHKLSKTLAHRQMREKEISELKSLGKTNQEILEIVYEGLDVRLHKYAMKTIEAHLKKLKL